MNGDSILSEPSRRKGITLIELLVMLAIVTILSLLSIPLYKDLSEYYRITTAVQQLHSILEYARTEAVKRNTSVYVSVTTGDSWCYGVNTGSACTCTTASSCNLGAVSAPAPQLLTLSATGLSSSAFYFDNIHAGASNTVTLTYTLYGQSSLITTTISRMGSISTCSTGISGYTSC